MSIATVLFERAGIAIAEHDIEQLVIDALQDVLPSRPALDPRETLSEAEQTALRRGGLSLEPLPSDSSPLRRSAAAYAALLASSLSVAQVAEMLGVDPSRIRHRLLDRTLYGIRQRSGWRIPAFQFDEQETIPGLDQVLPRLDPTLHPLEILRWFTQPHTDLVDSTDPEEAPISPLDWLRTGRDPRIAADLAADVGLIA